MTTLGERLEYLRTVRGLNKQQFAAAVGVTDTTVANWEASRKEPRASHVAAVCKRFAVSADWLLGLEKG